MELNIRTKALLDYLFGFDLKRCNEVAVEVAEEMNIMKPGVDWDHMDGREFTSLASEALGKVRDRCPGLFE